MDFGGIVPEHLPNNIFKGISKMNLVGIKDFYPTLLSFENTIKKSGSRNLMLLEMYIQQKGNINWVIRDSLRSSIHTSFGLIILLKLRKLRLFFYELIPLRCFLKDLHSSLIVASNSLDIINVLYECHVCMLCILKLC